jgi:hypothetical protein
MAVVCAVVASWYLSGAYCAVGNTPEGYFMMPATSAWHPDWRAELRSSLDREEGASCFSGPETPPYVERPELQLAPRGERAIRSKQLAARPIRDVASPGCAVRASAGTRAGRGATVQVGYVNRNQQEVVRATGRPGTDHTTVRRCTSSDANSARRSTGATGPTTSSGSAPSARAAHLAFAFRRRAAPSRSRTSAGRQGTRRPHTRQPLNASSERGRANPRKATGRK